MNKIIISRIQAATMFENLARAGYDAVAALNIFSKCNCTPNTKQELFRSYTCPIHGDSPEKAKCGCQLDKVLAGQHTKECQEQIQIEQEQDDD